MAWPDCRPKMPWRFGPCLCAPPDSTVWHCEHFVLNIFAPFALIVPTENGGDARRRGGGVDACALLRAFAAKKTSRSCMGLSDVRGYCCGVALRVAYSHSAAIKYETHLRPATSVYAERCDLTSVYQNLD